MIRIANLVCAVNDHILQNISYFWRNFSMHNVRPAAVAGAFYPGTAETLTRDIDLLLRDAKQPALPTSPKAVIVPHAGYIYSGPIAASAYAALAALGGIVRRVVLLGPVHRVPVRGLATPGATAFSTPLGTVQVDQDAILALTHLNQIVESAPAHAWEHSLEVQLPFLQTVLGEFKLVPLAVGDATAEEVAEVLDLLWGGTETLIVVSSDLSHYLPYDMARNKDQETVQSVLDLHTLHNHEQACGATPINGLIVAAKRHHLTPRLLDLRNSGDTAGDKGHVVGYAAFAFLEEARDVH
jgi:AmmeMemoRadiSam system protein B